MTVNARWQFVLLYTAPQSWRRRALEDVSAAVLDRAIGVGAEHGLPLHHFSLEDTAKAHAAVEGGAVGKVLIDVVE
jgi:NADPH2:quinone reductase